MFRPKPANNARGICPKRKPGRESYPRLSIPTLQTAQLPGVLLTDWALSAQENVYHQARLPHRLRNRLVHEYGQDNLNKCLVKTRHVAHGIRYVRTNLENKQTKFLVGCKRFLCTFLNIFRSENRIINLSPLIIRLPDSWLIKLRQADYPTAYFAHRRA